MKLQQLLVQGNTFEEVYCDAHFQAQEICLVLAFGQTTLLEKHPPFQLLQTIYPKATILICSSSGQISNNVRIEEAIVVTAIQLEKASFKALEFEDQKDNSIVEMGKKFSAELLTPDLRAVLLLSEGTHVNGSELIQELITQSDGKIPFFGGLAGDEYRFEKTIVGLNADAQPGKIVAVGFYGEGLKFGFASEGGWADFGPEREVTHSNKNVLYRIGDRNALELYKDYLGKYA
ncbi:FIST signal transduction protein, partial [Flavobacterium sp.]